jgi:hypothetical protein
MFAQSPSSVVSIFASTLGDPRLFQPVANVDPSEAASWITPPPALFNFPKMPPRSDERTRWTSAMGGKLT